MSNGESVGVDRPGLVLEDRGEWKSSTAEESPEELLRTCADLRDAPAWDGFMRHFNPLIVGTVVRTMRRYGFDGSGLIDDLVQEVYLKLAANRAKVLREFEPRYPGAVFGYLRVIAANVVHDYFKSKTGRPTDWRPLPEDLAGPDAQAEVEWRLLLRDIDDLLRKARVWERDRQIFWLYYRQGMSAKQIAAIANFKLSTEGVETVIVKLNKLIRKALEDSERQ
ncbi:MAG: RNA polymerase sigma factor [Bryobacteraceae bacterium]